MSKEKPYYTKAETDRGLREGVALGICISVIITLFLLGVFWGNSFKMIEGFAPVCIEPKFRAPTLEECGKQIDIAEERAREFEKCCGERLPKSSQYVLCHGCVEPADYWMSKFSILAIEDCLSTPIKDDCTKEILVRETQ